MSLLFLLLSPTFGMHQYTADLANRLAEAGEEVHLLTTAGYPADRYAPAVRVHTPVRTVDAGFSRRGLRPAPLQGMLRVIETVQPRLVHFTGPHLWNLPLLRALRRRGLPTVHTLHDLAPHPGSPYGPLLRVWNRRVLRYASEVVVHSRAALAQAQTLGGRGERVHYIPLLHGFWGYASAPSSLAPPSSSLVLFFGRLERYKGVEVLLRAWALLDEGVRASARLALAGKGDLSRLWPGPLPPGVELLNRHIADEEAISLFQRSAVLVLPYTGATQSALVAAAYHFGRPVIVSDSGALAEYVMPGRTGWVTPSGDARALAQALTQALADPARLAEMGAAGRAWYEDARIQEWQAWRALYGRLTADAPARKMSHVR